MRNLYGLFKEALESTSKPIVITENKKYSFQEIDTITGQIATILLNLGMKPEDRLAVQIKKSEYNLFLYLACLRSGFIYLPLNSTYTNDELDYFFNDAKPKVIICDPKKEKEISNIKSASNLHVKTLDNLGNGTLLSELHKINGSDIIYNSKPNDIAVILYTSGTTGKPKGAMLTHQGLYINALDLNKTWGISTNDTILHMLPLFHVHGLFFATHTALLSGASLLLLPKFDNELFFKYLSYSTIFMGVPTYYIRLLKDLRLNIENTKHIRLFISGSAPLLPSTFNEFNSKTNHKILERYGMTETGINTSNPLNGERKIGSVGLPLPNVNIRIVDEDNKPVSINEIGSIQVKGPNLFLGYWQNPIKTKEDMTNDGFFNTGDLGSVDEDGYLSISGRSKDMIISGGLNIYPIEIETSINAIEGVIESAIIGIPHEDFGEAVIAVLEGDKSKLTEELIVLEVKKHHAPFKAPKKVIFIDQLPKNTMGKVQKNILRDLYKDIFSTNNSALSKV
ncbi:MAG: AMP-binding protein [Sphingobacteriia bacterium]|nr:AMP-binding protein [Sphingobacteriia bacterium]